MLQVLADLRGTLVFLVNSILSDGFDFKSSRKKHKFFYRALPMVQFNSCLDLEQSRAEQIWLIENFSLPLLEGTKLPSELIFYVIRTLKRDGTDNLRLSTIYLGRLTELKSLL